MKALHFHLPRDGWPQTLCQALSDKLPPRPGPWEPPLGLFALILWLATLKPPWANRALKLLTIPVVYTLLPPLALLDLITTLYQGVCFPIYGMEPVKRGEFLVMDRYHLPYLDGMQKLNCLYCEYANGVIAYTREVASRTEAYWCPIKHQHRIHEPHPRYQTFADYGDETGFHHRYKEQRYG